MFGIIFILLLYALTFLFTDTMVKVVQMVQLIFFHVLISSQLPASLYFYLLEFKLSLFQFLPNWPGLAIVDDLTIHATSNQKTIDIFLDYNFSRNVGQIFFFIVFLIPFWLIFLILSNRRVVEHKKWNTFFSLISHRRFRFMILNDIASVLYLPVLIFGFYQFQELFGEGYMGFNGFITLVFVLAFLALPFIWTAIWCKK